MRQGVYYTKAKFSVKPKFKPSEPITYSNEVKLIPKIQSNKMNIWVDLIRKLYTDDTRSFPIRSHRGNQYIIIAFHCDPNTILQSPFKTKNDKHRIKPYNSIMIWLKSRGQKVNLQILDKGAITYYKQVIGRLAH